MAHLREHQLLTRDADPSAVRDARAAQVAAAAHELEEHGRLGLTRAFMQHGSIGFSLRKVPVCAAPPSFGRGSSPLQRGAPLTKLLMEERMTGWLMGLARVFASTSARCSMAGRLQWSSVSLALRKAPLKYNKTRKGVVSCARSAPACGADGHRWRKHRRRGGGCRSVGGRHYWWELRRRRASPQVGVDAGRRTTWRSRAKDS